MMRIIIKSIISLILSMTSLLLMTEVYKEKIVDKFNFGGFVGAESKHLVLGYLIIIVAIIFSIFIKSRAFKFYSSINIIFLLQPSLVLMTIGNQDLWAYLTIVGAFFVVGIMYLILNIAWKTKTKNVEIIKYVKIMLDFPIIVIGLVLITIAIKVNYELRLEFSRVYDYRFELNDLFSFPYNYVLPFAAGPLLGFATVLALAFKSYYKLLMLIIFGFLYYGFTTHKSYLFIPMFCIVIYYSSKIKFGLMNLMQIGIILMSAITIISDNEITDLITSLIANRVLFLPSLITYAYIAEFSNIDYLLWSESKISLGLIKSPISDFSVNHIGWLMTGDAKNVANVGWVANGFMNLGNFGVFIYSLFIAALLKIIEGWDSAFGEGLILSAFSITIMNLVLSVDIIVSLLSTGLLFMIIYVYCVKFFITRNTRI